MTNHLTCKISRTPKACPEEVTELYFVSHPRASKAVLGPFLSEADADSARRVLRNPSAMITSSLVEHLDKLSHWLAINNGQLMRYFADGAR